MAASVIGNKELDIKYGADYVNTNVADDNDYVTVESSKPINFENGIMVGGEHVSSVAVEPILTSGTQIATVSIDGNETTIYAPAGGGSGSLENIVDGSATGSARSVGSSNESASYTMGLNAMALGENSKASGRSSFTEGGNNTSSGDYSHSEGYMNTSSGLYAHAEGTSVTASNASAHAEGNSTTASGADSHAEGNTTTASSQAAHAEGSQTTAAGQWTHAEGRSTYANGQAAHAEGNSSKALSSSSHAEGRSTIASNTGAHAEGFYAISSGYGSHVEGQGDQVSIAFSTPVGQTSKRQWSGNYSRFFKIYGICNSYSPNTVVSFWKPEYNSSTDVTVFAGNGLPNDFPAEGTLIIYTQQSSSQGSHAEGRDCLAIGNYSHAEGKSTVASRKSNHVFGEYNMWDVVGNSSTDRGTYVEIVGNGTSETNRSNARTLDWSGNQVNAGTVTATDFVIPGASGTSLSTIAQSIINIPTKTSDLSNDSGFITKDVNDLTNYTLSSNLATVATTGSYTDLTNTPSIPAAQVQSDWSQTDNTALDYIKNKPNLATVATTGSYTDLSNTPTIPDAVSVTQIQSAGTKIATITVGSTGTDIYAPTGGGVTEDYVKGWVGNQSTTNSSATASQTDDTFLVSNVSAGLALTITATSDTVLSGRYIEYAGSITTTNGGTLAITMPSGVTTVWMDGSNSNSFTMSAGKTYVYSIVYCKTAAKAYGSIHEVGQTSSSQVQSDWTQTDNTKVDYIKNKPSLATVATSGSYNDLSNKPSLATVATSGSYADLSNKPTIPSATSDLNNDSGFITNTVNNLTNYTLSSALATVATSGSYADLSNKPTIPDAVTVTQVQSSGTKIATIAVGSTSTDLYAPAGGGSSVQSDWNQNDSTQDDYIKNRTHWIEDAYSQDIVESDSTTTITPGAQQFDPWQVVIPSGSMVSGSTIAWPPNGVYNVTITFSGGHVQDAGSIVIRAGSTATATCPIEVFSNSSAVYASLTLTQSGDNLGNATLGSVNTTIYTQSGTQNISSGETYTVTLERSGVIHTLNEYFIPHTFNYTITAADFYTSGSPSISLTSVASQVANAASQSFVKSFVGETFSQNCTSNYSQTCNTFVEHSVYTDLSLTIATTTDYPLSSNMLEYTGSITSSSGGTLTVTVPTGRTLLWQSGTSLTLAAGKTYVYSIAMCTGTWSKIYGAIQEYEAIS